MPHLVGKVCGQLGLANTAQADQYLANNRRISFGDGGGQSNIRRPVLAAVR
ncbi:hypothetical protein [Micromonospora sp. WMMD1082]|uniref:hypothetical protein n=1 Tax=Micromonospora sp. WMMD1082 TaxID=3016104 RepID=UPI002417A40F|nr:hypothetical protein [Micromonospora sp. WMMD1082]MDG4793501.1 hypothetical protein [Micromonospora sp. WMMD1082]